MLGWLFANLFLLTVVGIGAGLVWLVGFLMWRAQMPPDDYPLIVMIGMGSAIYATYWIAKRLHAWLGRYVR